MTDESSANQTQRYVYEQSPSKKIFYTYEVVRRIMLSQNLGVSIQVIVPVQIAQTSNVYQDKHGTLTFQNNGLPKRDCGGVLMGILCSLRDNFNSCSPPLHFRGFRTCAVPKEQATPKCKPHLEFRFLDTIVRRTTKKFAHNTWIAVSAFFKLAKKRASITDCHHLAGHLLL